MICQNCQEEVADLSFCPYCGYRLDGPAEYPPQEHNPHGKPSKRVRRRRFLRRWLLPLLILIAVIAFGVLSMAMRGFNDGVQERNREIQQQAEIHFNRGSVYLETGWYQMAAAEFEEALRLVPDHAEAEGNLRIAQIKQTVTPSPTPPPPTPSPTPTATPVLPTPTPEQVIIPVTDILFNDAQAYYEDQEWEQAISKLEQLRNEDITYKSDQVAEMLFQSYYHYGLELDEQGLVEAAISQYSRALTLRPRHPEVEPLRRRADLYQSALDAWDVNWEKVVNFLTALYALAPDYRDTSERFYQACTTLAQALVKQERYCAASVLYQQALEIRDDDPKIVKLEDDTRYLCQFWAWFI